MSRRIAPPIGFILSVFLVVGCGDDPTGSAVINVSGVYQVTGQENAATCDPPSAAGELEPVLVTGEPIPFQGVIRIEQQGDQITWKALELDGQDIEATSLLAVGTFDSDARFRVEAAAPATPFMLGDRTFFDQPSSTVEGRFNLAAEPVTFTSTSSGTEVFREGSATAPVFAACTSTGSATAIRTGD
jgi:hypothetical protein